MSKLNKAIIIILAAAILVTAGFIVYLRLTPQSVNKFTEFYILNAEGQARDYPEAVTAGNPVDIILGVVNHEYEPVTYHISIQIGGVEVKEVNVGTLAYQQKWEEQVDFTPQAVGDRQTVDFILYKNGSKEPYLKEPLRLHIDVVPSNVFLTENEFV
jgi:uncharacterized membrane protein